MRLESLQLQNFKNYGDINLKFPARINVLVGKNGSGKTNLLDAIFYLSSTKSAFSSSDLHCIRHDQGYFMLKGAFHMDTEVCEIISSVQVGTKKLFRDGHYEYPRLSEHIGKYPVILVAPDDVDLVKEGSDARRKFFDGMISQLDRTYLEDLIQYNQVLKQRNSLLKMAHERGAVDWIAIESYDHLLIKNGQSIFKKRHDFSKEFLPVFARFFQFIVSDRELTGLEYASELTTKDFQEGLLQTRQKDLALQRTSFGIHRDDYLFTLEGGEIKRLGSQGQQKSFVVALKLAQYEIVKNHKGFEPILLLDDIFDKLDDYRIARILELIKTNLGQMFITDARPDRTRGLLDQIEVEACFFSIEGGKVNDYAQS